ncbi:DNA-dependent ATPase mgs1 [Neophaeococcomyces mojaviensis]|uniref:DNA-dependent ATPase mgs1 n=1 Tax=Neophaeococcomyces mojaviensis TaxID=3383035 RepID=A0ACC3A831_9EURO|nr:DNA-dependent ATPase mgs1 [Knufia sp. JES_112]
MASETFTNQVTRSPESRDTQCEMVSCPICGKNVKQSQINEHIDSNCTIAVESDPPPSTAPIFKTPVPKRELFFASSQPVGPPSLTLSNPKKRTHDVEDHEQVVKDAEALDLPENAVPQPAKRVKSNAFERAAPLAERMRPRTLDDVYGQELVGPNGVLRGLIEQDRVPSMILWGQAGTGKTTIARVISNMVGSRFVEINSTSTGVAECKKIFAEAKSELGLTGRKTIIFCDEIHRFSKSQQDVFLGPVEAGHVTLIGATTENPSFKVQNALLSRCRTFTLTKLTDENVKAILERALALTKEMYSPKIDLVDTSLLSYLASFADGDARTALNLLELAMELSTRPDMTIDNLKSSLTKTLVYDRAGDQHYDTISAFHKSVRGSNADAALYYLARMIQSGEDALYIARRMVVMASEDIGLADNAMLSLATATYSACEKIGLPECRINLAHCAVAFCLAPKSTRAYRSLNNAMSVLDEPGVAGLPIPVHLRNAPTRLMKELGYGKEYKYNPNYVNGMVKQDYLPDKLIGRTFLEERDLGTDVDLEYEEEQARYAKEDVTIVNGDNVQEAELALGVAEQEQEDEHMSSQTEPPEEWQ